MLQVPEEALPEFKVTLVDILRFVVERNNLELGPRARPAGERERNILDEDGVKHSAYLHHDVVAVNAVHDYQVVAVSFDEGRQVASQRRIASR